MTSTIHSAPLVQREPIWKGFLGGSLAVAGVLLPFGQPLQLVLAVVGILVFIDAVIPPGEVSIVASVLSAIVGGILSAAATVLEAALPWTVILVVFAVVAYGRRFRRRLAAHPAASGPPGPPHDSFAPQTLS